MIDLFVRAETAGALVSLIGNSPFSASVTKKLFSENKIDEYAWAHLRYEEEDLTIVLDWARHYGEEITVNNVDVIQLILDGDNIGSARLKGQWVQLWNEAQMQALGLTFHRYI